MALTNELRHTQNELRHTLGMLSKSVLASLFIPPWKPPFLKYVHNSRQIAWVVSCTMPWTGTQKCWPAYSWEQCCAISSCPLWRHLPAIFFINLRIFSFALFIVSVNLNSPSGWITSRLHQRSYFFLTVRILAVISLVPYLWKDTIIQISSTTQLLNNC